MKMDTSIKLLTESVKDLYSKVNTIEHDSSDNLTTLVDHIKKMMIRIKKMETSLDRIAEFDAVKAKIFELESMKSKVSEFANITLKVINLEHEILEVKESLESIKRMVDTIFVQSHNPRIIQLEESVRYLLSLVEKPEEIETENMS